MMQQKIEYICNDFAECEMIVCQHSILSYPLHTHSTVITFSLVLDGEVCLNKQGAITMYSKGDMFTILSNVPHSIQANKRYSLLTLCIDKQSFLHRNASKRMNSISEFLSYALTKKYIDTIQFFNLANYIQTFHYADVEQFQTHIHQLKFQIEHFCEQHYSINDMSHISYTSKYHLIRTFKKAVGITPHQFQLQTRIRKAQKLLHEYNTIAEVAFVIGFCDESHFIKCFKKIVGLSPTTFKYSCVLLN